MKALILLILLIGCTSAVINEASQQETLIIMNETNTTTDSEYELATFAGGCFWCIEADLEKLEGTLAVVSGYSGGEIENPTYDNYNHGSNYHLEAVQVTYDPSKISYGQLVEQFYLHIDPTDPEGMFVDRGPYYSSAIWYHNEEQKKEAERITQKLSASGVFEKPIITPIIAVKTFWPAEEYHQDYYKNRSIRYKFYRGGSGRNAFIATTEKKVNETGYVLEGMEASIVDQATVKTYSKPSDQEIQEKLTLIQYKVTQEDGTEKPFENEYWDNKREGIYVDIVSGEPLFSSKDKYKSGTGWPSFYEMLEPENIVTKKDYKLILPRTEVRSKHGDSHLGHLFKDGPDPTGLRYCLNSASLRFVPKEELAEQGYGKYLSEFE